MPIWEASFLLEHVYRWGGGISKNGNGLQPTVVHINQFQQFADAALIVINPYFIERKKCTLDTSLILQCVKFHDNGETRGDTLARLKNEKRDLKEYRIFMRSICKLPDLIKKSFEEAFLLQFSLNIPQSFPKRAKKIMKKLAKDRFYEAVVFKGLEKFEYLFFPIWSKNSDLLRRVIWDEIADYRYFSEKIPGFREEFFTEELENWMLECIYPLQHSLQFT